MTSPRYNTTISSSHGRLLEAVAGRLETRPTTLASRLLERALEEHCGDESILKASPDVASQEVLWRLVLLLNLALHKKTPEAQTALEAVSRKTAAALLEGTQ